VSLKSRSIVVACILAVPAAPLIWAADTGTSPETTGQLQEVTVTAHRLAPSIPIEKRRRFYIESSPAGPDESGMLYENGRLCVDGSLPPPKRLEYCNMSIWMIVHGASMEDEDRAKAYLARGDAFQQNGENDAALKDFRTAGKYDPYSPRPWIEIGNLFAAKSDYEHALEDYDHAMALAPDDAKVNDSHGVALQGLGRHEEAIADFSRAIELDPNDKSAYSNRAAAYLSLKRQDLAIADLNQVILGAPSDALAYYDRAVAYEVTGRIDAAEADYRKVVSLTPAFAPASAALGRLDSKVNADLALAELGTAIRLDPKSPALKTRAILYLSIQQPEHAIPDLDLAIANDPSDDAAWANRGVAKSRTGDLAGATVDCTRAIEIAPTVANLVNRGNAYANLHRPNEALADFDTALQLEPRNLPALLGRANADYASRRLSASLDDFTRVIGADPSNALAYFKRGNIHLDLREFAPAFSDYSESLKRDPNQAVVLLNRSIAAARLGRRTDAARDQRLALDLDPQILDDRR
jgi:tetratricopeptide (TPR) repeat protein